MNNNKFYITNYVELRKLVMDEMHKVPYTRQHGYQKTITVVRNQYFGHKWGNT